MCRVEFAAHELDEVITLRHRNVCQDGFDLTDEVDSGESIHARLTSPHPGPAG